MSQPDKSSRIAVLLFTDVVDSVGLQTRLGAEEYARLLRIHDQLFREALHKVGDGVVRNDMGDGFLAEFKTAAGAVNAALLFQMVLRKTTWERESPKVRIGIHQGHVTEIQGETLSPHRIVGMTVNIAARVMELAAGKQILLTRPVYDDARQFVRQHPPDDEEDSPPPPVKWKSHGEFILQGVEGRVEIFEVGADGFAPLSQPHNSIKARSAKELSPAVESRYSKWRPVAGAIVTALCSLALWQTTLGERWINASYDYLFRFGARAVTNQVALIQMDNSAYAQLHQKRGYRWDRALHAKLLNRLTRDGSSLVVFDIFFDEPRELDKDAALAEAMRRNGRVVLMAKVNDPKHPLSENLQVQLPHQLFLNAATNWGIGKANASLGETVRKHWPFPAPWEPYVSLPWKAVELSRAPLDNQPHEQWLRYYGEQGGWKALSYHLALEEAPGYFHDKIVFIGSEPDKKDDPGLKEEDKFRTPYTRWNSETVGGVDILATEFLNLLNHEWLRRPAPWVEALILLITGLALGGGLTWMRFWLAGLTGAGVVVVVTLVAAALSYYTNFWFPWLIIVGGQVPCALACCFLYPKFSISLTGPHGTVVLPPATSPAPAVSVDTPDYDRLHLFGSGSFGEVWLVRNAIGQMQALKIVYRKKFDDDRPYDTEYEGIQKFKPVSEKHPGLLRTEFVSRKRPQGYFYYVMELGDAQFPGWEKKPSTYKPRTLASICAQAPGKRLSVKECLRIGSALTEALGFLHASGLTHRDIKPSNVIFVDGVPKLADVGLVTEVRVAGNTATRIGTPGYMPPEPEPLGTVAADIYGLGMVLYVISTGSEPDTFSNPWREIPEAEFSYLKSIILKACQLDLNLRYHSALEVRQALLLVEKTIAGGGAT